jgi:phosphatidylinositol 4-kinase
MPPSSNRYLFNNPSPAVQEYLCQRLHELSEPALEKYLLELVYIAVERPSSNLEHAIIDLCSKSFRIAVKVSLAGARRRARCGRGSR